MLWWMGSGGLIGWRLSQKITPLNSVNKPKLLDGLTILMALLNMTAFLMLSDDEVTRLIELTITILFVIFTFWVLFKFNRGFNWARILVLITSVVALLNLFGLQYFSKVIQGFIAFEAVLAIYLLYWLNTAKVKKYFAPNQERRVD